MAIRALRKISTTEVELAKLQANISEWAEQILPVPILDGILLKNVILTAGQVNMVPHGLNRPWIGYIVVANNADSRVYNSTENILASTQLPLNVSATSTVNLWVF